MLVLVNISVWINISSSVFRMPFNWRTPYGYAIVLFLQIADVSSVLYCATLLFAFFIGSCWLCIVFVKDVANDLDSLNSVNATNGNASNNNNDRLMTERFFNVVQYYCDVKQLSMKSSLHYLFTVLIEVTLLLAILA